MTRPPPPTLGQLGELRTIRALRQVLDRPATDLVVGNGDDALVWRPEGDVVATVDAVVEGTDWLAAVTPAEAIGHRAAAVNLSDLAAMGAQPRHLLLAVEAPPSLPADVLVRAARGLAALADRWSCAVAGGDLGLVDGPLRLTVTALGQLQGPALRRTAARPGDAVWLVGAVGLAALGLEVVRRGGAGLDAGTGLGGGTGLEGGAAWARTAVQAHLWPQPQVDAGRILQTLAAQGHRLACIDVSDGLALDAGRLAAASQVGMVLTLPPLPWPDEALAFCARHGLVAAELAGSGGDDYALLVCAPRDLDLAAAIAQRWPRQTPPPAVERVGQVTVGPAGKVMTVIGDHVVSGSGWLHGRSAP